MQVHLTTLGERWPEHAERQYLEDLPATLTRSVQRLRRWEDRQASLKGKLLLQRALRLLGTPASLADLRYGPSGKPYIEEGPHFNISHSGGMIALVLSGRGPVGIDVERIREIEVADFIPYLPELRQPASAALESFFDCWTSKEAVLKGEGDGLLVPLQEVRLEEGGAVCRGRRWHLRGIDCGPEYRCHLASREDAEGCKIEVINLER